ncbi:MAG: GNAT family N-acetyltransferase [Proteobacteria bacterium]|nr:GNAT family N-acetyltransferase [Pseudomonadota bacterium]
MTESGLEIMRVDLGRPEHAEAVRSLLDEYARDPMGNGGALADGVLDAVVPALAAEPAALIWLAYRAGEPVGVATCFRGFSTFAAKPLVNVHDLAVRASERGRGVGRALLERVEAEARSLGCCKVTLEVRGDNQRAQHLYRNLGFTGLEGPSTTFFCTKPLL